MEWHHSVSLEWLRVRQRFLTASDMHKVVSITPTGKKRTHATQVKAMQTLWAEKQKLLDEDDTYTTGVMARGHILEPYAVDAFNEAYRYKLSHVDDRIIVSHDHPRLAWSPDAIQLNDGAYINTAPSEGQVFIDPSDISVIGEIKSYAEATHYRVGMCLDGEDKTEERWQIATAFVVRPDINAGFLILYNPACKEQMFARAYFPEQLEREIEEIKKTYATWVEVVEELEEKAKISGKRCVSKTERVINDEWIQDNFENTGLDPV